jgi:hypothetical protein
MKSSIINFDLQLILHLARSRAQATNTYIDISEDQTQYFYQLITNVEDLELGSDVISIN